MLPPTYSVKRGQTDVTVVRGSNPIWWHAKQGGGQKFPYHKSTWLSTVKGNGSELIKSVFIATMFEHIN